MVGLDVLPRSWQRLINNNGEIRGTSLKGYLYPQSKFNLDLLFHSDHTCLSQAKSQTSYFHTSASSHNSDLDMKYSNAALPTVIGSEIPHHKPHGLCALCFSWFHMYQHLYAGTYEECKNNWTLIMCVSDGIIVSFTSYCICGFGQNSDKNQTQSFWPTVGKRL